QPPLRIPPANVAILGELHRAQRTVSATLVGRVPDSVHETDRVDDPCRRSSIVGAVRALALLPEVQLNEAVGVGGAFPRESGETGGWLRYRWRESRHASTGSAPIEARRDKCHLRRSLRRSRRTLVCLLRRSLQPPFAGL